jgi:hypothetical protein
LAPLTFFDGGENPLTNFTASASVQGYTVRQTAYKYIGTYGFHLAHPQPVNHSLTLQRFVVPGPSSSLRFYSRLTWAMPNQIAKVQVSVDDGQSWADIFVQSGDDEEGDVSFREIVLNLGVYAGRAIRLRFNYVYSRGPWYNQTDGVGWFFDNIELLNAQEAFSPQVAPANSAATFTFTPAASGNYWLDVRPKLFGDYAGEWGQGLAVTAVPGVRISTISPSGGNWRLDFQFTEGSSAGFELWSAPSAAGPYAIEPGATIETVVPNSQFRATVTRSDSTRFFRIRVL